MEYRKLKFPLILGSKSPTRLSLLKQMHILANQQLAADISEIAHTKELPRNFANRMAIEKMTYFIKQDLHKNNIIITCDTVAACGRRILQKPTDKIEAANFLDLLSGRRHRVFTGVCFIHPGLSKPILKTAATILKFKKLHIKEKEYYLQSQEWQNKAGGYGIQGLGSIFVEWINGREDTIAGLPLNIINKLLSGLYLY